MITMHDKSSTEKIRKNLFPENSFVNTEKRISIFFEDIKSVFNGQDVRKNNIVFVVVAHAVPDQEDFFKALEQIGRIGKILIKGGIKLSEIPNNHDKIVDNLYENIAFFHNYKDVIDEKLTKEFIIDNPYCISSILTGIGINNENPEQFVIIDIGGYFSPIIPILNADLSLKNKIACICEDTENGEQKYINELERAGTKNQVAVYSVARAKVKRTEDYNVGKSIVANTARMLEEIALSRPSEKVRLEDIPCVGVIGFGKIGSSIADHLRQKNVKKLMICDHAPDIAMMASAQGYRVVNKEMLLKRATVIFSATGNRALSPEDFESVKQKNIYISSCTSPDDEFDLPTNFNNSKNKEKIKGVACVKITTSQNNNIYFLAEGKAANFYYRTNALGNYICGVQAALIVSVLKHFNNINQSINIELNTGKCLLLDEKEERKLAKIWLKHFENVSLSRTNLYRYADNSKIGYYFEKELSLTFLRVLNNNNNRVMITGNRGVGKSVFIHKFALDHIDNFDYIWSFTGNIDIRSVSEFAHNLNIKTYDIKMENIFSKIAQNLLNRFSCLIIIDSIEKLNEASMNFIRTLSASEQKTKFIIVLRNNNLDTEISKFLTDYFFEMSLDCDSFYQAHVHYNSLMGFDESRQCEIIFQDKPIANPSFVHLCGNYFKGLQDYDRRLRIKDIMGKDSLENAFTYLMDDILKYIRSMMVNGVAIAFEFLTLLSFIDSENVSVDFIECYVQHLQQSYNPFAKNEISKLLALGLIFEIVDHKNNRFLRMPSYLAEIIQKSLRNDKVLWLTHLHKVVGLLEYLLKEKFTGQKPDKRNTIKVDHFVVHVEKLYEMIKSSDMPIVEHEIQYLSVATESECQGHYKNWRKQEDRFCKFIYIKIETSNESYFFYEDIFGGLYYLNLDDSSESHKLSELFKIEAESHNQDSLNKLLPRILSHLKHSSIPETKLSTLLERLGNYYLNEVRIYKKAVDYYDACVKSLEKLTEVKDGSNVSLCKKDTFLLYRAIVGQIASLLHLFKFSSSEDEKTDIEKTIAILKKKYNPIVKMLEFIGGVEKTPQRDVKQGRLILFGFYLAENYKHRYLFEKIQEKTEIKHLNESMECLKQSEKLLNELSTPEKIQPQLQQAEGLLAHCRGTLMLRFFLCDKERSTLEEAATFLKKALEIRSSLYEDHPDLARTQQKYSVVQYKLAKISQDKSKMIYLQEAQKYARLAYEIQLKYLPEDHPNLSDTINIREKIKIKMMQTTTPSSTNTFFKNQDKIRPSPGMLPEAKKQKSREQASQELDMHDLTLLKSGPDWR